jgi:hypothetical protein
MTKNTNDKIEPIETRINKAKPTTILKRLSVCFKIIEVLFGE